MSLQSMEKTDLLKGRQLHPGNAGEHLQQLICVLTELRSPMAQLVA